jgi:hypothetical protein
MYNSRHHSTEECREIKKLTEQFRERQKQQTRQDGMPSRQQEGKQKVDPEEDKGEEMEFQNDKRALKAVYGHSDPDSSSGDEHRKQLHVMYGDSWDNTSKRVVKGHHIPVMFRTSENYNMESVLVDVAEVNLPFNAILGRPTLYQFLTVAHYGYLVLKMPPPNIIIKIRGDCTAAISALEKLQALAAAHEAATGPGGQDPASSSSRQRGSASAPCAALGQ